MKYKQYRCHEHKGELQWLRNSGYKTCCNPGKDTFKNSNKKKRHNIYIFSLEDLDNDDIISMVETTPTFQRTKTVLESIQSKAIAEEEETFNNDTENGGITITF